MADETKLQEERIKAQKGLNKQFKALTTKLAETDESLGKTAANLRTNTKVTFEGFLSSRKLAKATADAANDPQLLEAIQKSAELNDAITASLNAQEKIKQEAERAVVSARKNNVELKGLIDDKKTIQENEYKLLEDGIDIVEARLITEKALGENLKAISEKEQSIRDLYNNKLEKQTKKIEKHNKSLEISIENEEKQRDRLEANLKESTESEGFGKFNSAVKDLSGGLIDVGGGLDKVVEFGTNLATVGLTLAKFFGFESLFSGMGEKFKSFKDGIGSLASSVFKGAKGLNEGLQNVAKDAMSMGKGLFGKKNKDGSKDMRFKENKESADAMQRMSQRMTAATTAFTDGMKLVGTKLLSGAKKFIPAIGALIASTVMFVGGLLLTAVGLLPLALPLIAVAVAVGLVIGLVVAGFKYLYNEVEGFRNSVDFLIEGVKSIATFVMDFVGTLNFSAITDMFGEMWEAIKGVFSGLITFFKGAFAGDFEMMFQGIKDIFNSVLDYIKAPFKAVAKFFGGGDKPQDMIDAEASGLVIDKMGREDGLDKKKLKDAPNGQLKAILAEGDMSKENLALVQEELNARDLKPAAESQSGQEVGTSTQEVKQGEKQGNIVNVVNQSSSPTSVNNTQVHNASGSPRDTDRTALSLNAIAV
jgi:hypothetical protein